jgi:hypothetical protein
MQPSLAQFQLPSQSPCVLLLYRLKPLKLYRFRAGDHHAKGKFITDDR